MRSSRKSATPFLRRWIGTSSLAALFLLLACGAPAPPPVILPDMGRLSDFELVDQFGRPFTRQSLAGRTWVLDFIFTTCQNACPRMTGEMQKIQKAVAADPSVRLLTISVDPDTDTPEVLMAFARRRNANLDRWVFATGDKETVRRLQREASIDMDLDQLQLPHNKCLLLVDGEGNIRGSYESDPPETGRLLADLRALQRNPTLPEPLQARTFRKMLTESPYFVLD